MKKTKVTLAGALRLYEGLQKEFEKYRLAAKNYAYELRNPNTRTLLKIEAATPQGQINALTVVELIAIVNRADMTGEEVFLTAAGKTISVHAVRKPAPRPSEVF